jgi:DNA-directed RNA polymerase specialized sigma subunit
LRFAIGVAKTLRQSEIAKELGIITGRVSQIEKKALTKLRNRIEIIE